MKNILLLLIFLGSLTVNINGQFTETYFNENENKEGGKLYAHITGEDFIIIGGRTLDTRKYNPVITKIDTLGNILWSTTTLDSTAYTNTDVFVHRLMLSGNFLYATCIEKRTLGDTKQLWKIDAENGNLIWKRNFNTNHIRYPDYLVDYDEDKFLIGYCDNYNGTVYTIKMAFIDKFTGNVLSTHLIGDMNWSTAYYGLAVDREKSIYYSKLDTIYKVDYANPDSIIWKVQHPTADISDINHIYIDNNDSIYLFARKVSNYQRVRVISINNNSGELNWYVTLGAQDVGFKDMKDKNDFLYATWGHIYVGSAGHVSSAVKIDKETGIIEWETACNFVGVGTPNPYSGDYSGVTSIDTDTHGDVYLTGYYGDANYGPGCWGIIKLDGNTGNDIYPVTITEDSLVYDSRSIGLASCVINNKPYFIGELQTTRANYHKRSKVTFIKLDATTGNLLQKRYIGGKYQFPSKTIQIEKCALNKTAVLKQVGRYTKIDLYDIQNNLLWEKYLLKNYMLFGADLLTTDNGTIIFSAYSVNESDSYPYYSNQVDSIHVYYLDTTGITTNSYSFYVGLDGVRPIEILNDGSNTFIFYHKNNIIHFRKIDENGLTSEQNLSIEYFDQLSQTKHTVNHSESTILIFGYNNYENRVYEINKSTLHISDLGKIPTIRIINYVSKQGADKVLLCGYDITGNEMLVGYNTTLLDTIWTETYSPHAEMLKFTFDDDSVYIYSMGYRYIIGTSAIDGTIRKINTLNGLESWSYTYTGNTHQKNKPLDISFDKFRNQLIVTGYQQEAPLTSANKYVFITILDTSGTHIKSYTKQGDFDGDNMAVCSNVLHDGSTWVGGNFNHSIYNKAGFIYEIDSTFFNPSGWHSNTNTIQSIMIETYPNPFADYLNVKYTIYENNSDVFLNIFSVDGKPVYSYICKNEQKGEYNLRIETAEFQGIYVIKLQINDRILSKKILGVKK